MWQNTSYFMPTSIDLSHASPSDLPGSYLLSFVLPRPLVNTAKLFTTICIFFTLDYFSFLTRELQVHESSIMKVSPHHCFSGLLLDRL